MTNENNIHFPTPRPLFAVLVVTFLLVIGIELIWGFSGIRWKLLVLESAILLPAAIYSILKKLPLVPLFRLHPVRFRVLAASALLAAGVYVLTDELGRILQSVYPMNSQIQRGLEEVLTAKTPLDWIVILAASVLAAPVVEELLFRGFLQRSLEAEYGAAKAIGTTALVFAAVHFNPWLFVEILALGIVLGVVAWKSGSVAAAILIHGIINALSVVIINVDPAGLAWYSRGIHVEWVCILAAIFLSAAGIAGIFHWSSAGRTQSV